MRKRIIEYKSMLISDVVYILLQPVVSYFAFGKGCKNINGNIRTAAGIKKGTEKYIFHQMPGC